MFAVVETGGKQYKVAVDDVLAVEKLAGEAGDTVELSNVLLVGDDTATEIGTPYLSGKAVAAEIVEQTRGDKIIVFKKKRRQNYRRTAGHRQDLTILKILSIGEAGKAPKKAAKPTAKAAEKKAEPQKAEAKKPAAAEKEAAPKTAGKAEPKKAADKADKKAAPKEAEAKKPAAKKAAGGKSAKGGGAKAKK